MYNNLHFSLSLEFDQNKLCPYVKWNVNIYIFFALALDEGVILNVLQFPIQNIY